MAWLVQATGRVMYRTDSIRTYRFRSAHGALVLLVVLMAHLAYMAFPLHAEMMSEGSSDSTLVSMSAHEVADSLFVGTPPATRASDCFIQWAKSAPWMLLASLLAGAFVGVGGVVPLHFPVARSIAREHGPPSDGDPQAILQVFRL